MVGLNIGWLPLCESCLSRAETAKRDYLDAHQPAKLLKKKKKKKKRTVRIVSGGGANGTGRSSR
jgi:hypothetical protein